MAVHGFGAFGFDHYSGQGFGAGVADDYAAGGGEVGFGGGDGGYDGGEGVEGELFADLYVEDDLGVVGEVGDELAEGLVAAVDEVKNKQRGEEAVARGGAGGEEDVAGLFAAEGSTGVAHLFEDILVADGRAEHADAGAGEGGFEAHVGHGGGDDEVVGELAAGLEVARAGEHDGVAVDDVAVLVGEEGAVGVAVEGDAEGGSGAFDLGGDDLGVESATVLVDVAAVGGGVGDVDGAVEGFEELWGDGAGGAVGAVEDDVAVVEGDAGDSFEEEVDVVGAVGVVDFGEGGGFGEGWVGGEDAGYFALDAEFGFVGKLVAVVAEDLDAVVLPGIVRGGDDDAGGEAMLAGEEGDGGGGDDAGGFDRGASGAEAGGEGAGDPGAALTGVGAQDDADGAKVEAVGFVSFGEFGC